MDNSNDKFTNSIWILMTWYFFFLTHLIILLSSKEMNTLTSWLFFFVEFMITHYTCLFKNGKTNIVSKTVVTLILSLALFFCMLFNNSVRIV